METMHDNKKTNQWILFIGVILVLFGIYGTVRTIVNVSAFEKYPQEGVYPPFPFFSAYSVAPYAGRESDCTAYPQIYYKDDGRSTRPATDEEKAQEKIQQENCISGVKEARDKAKINDISQSLLFLFLGAGVLATKKIFK